MSYTAPTTRASGYIVTASAWNTDLVDNISFLANPPACRAYRTTAQSLTTGVAAAITFDAERYDTASMHSTSSNTSRITIVTAGLYLITGAVSFASNATGLREIFVALNGSTRLVDDLRGGVSGDATRMSVATVYKLAASDYVELFAYQTSGGNLNAENSGSAYPEMSATWVGLG